MSRLVCVFMALLIAGPAAADNVFLTEAKDHMERLDYENALKSLDAALARPGNSRDDVLTIYRLMGACQASLDQEPQAEEAFARLLSIDPSYRFPAKKSPRLNVPLERARVRVGAGIQVSLEQPKPETAKADFRLRLTLSADPVNLCQRAVLHLRADNHSEASKTTLQLKGKGDYALAPATVIKDARFVDYHVSIVDRWGGVLVELGTAGKPYHLEWPGGDGLVGQIQPASAWYETWWFWTVVGGIALSAASVGTYFLLQPEERNVDFSIHVR